MIFVWWFDFHGNTLAFFQTNSVLGFLIGFGILAFCSLKILHVIYLQDTYPQRKDTTAWVKALPYCLIMVGGYLVMVLGAIALVGGYGFWKLVQYYRMNINR